MNKKTTRIIMFFLIFLVIGSFFITTVYAGDYLSGVKPDISGNPAADTAKNVGNKVLGVIQIVGSAIAIAMVLFLGIKYMMAAPEEKASIKKSTTIYIIGAVVLFAASNIVGIIARFANDTIQKV